MARTHTSALWERLAAGVYYTICEKSLIDTKMHTVSPYTPYRSIPAYLTD